MAVTEDGVAQCLTKADLAGFRGLNGFHLFQREESPTRAGKIILVGKSDDKMRKEATYARVIRVGLPGRLVRPGKAPSGVVEPICLKEGDRVLLSKFAGYDIEEHETGKRFVIAAEQDVHLVTEGQEVEA